MHRTLTPRLFAVAAAAAVVLAYFRVASLPPSETPSPTYGWDTAISETVAAAHKTEIDLRSELANAANRGRANSEGLIKEKALIEDQLSQSKADRTKLQQEIAAMKREAEQTWAAERVENALLRERINDIAAEIARLTVALEGTDSPIEVMLAGEPAAINGQRAATGERKPAAGGEG